MSQPFLGEIKIISWNYPPKGWAFCNGQQLPINQNQALFSLLGTTYGGNGQTTFALPNFQGRVPVHIGQGINWGQIGGEEGHTLMVSELPAHNHIVRGSSAVATQDDPTGNVWASQTSNPYSSLASNTSMNPLAIGNAGGSQPHSNMQPYLVLNFIIALQGIFPSRN